MESLGNYWKHIKPEWIEYIKTQNGEQIPKDLKITLTTDADDEVGSDRHINEDELAWFKAGYDPSSVFLSGFDRTSCPYNFIEAFDFAKPDEDWWIVKYKPGQFMPWHRDVKCAREGCNTYWIPLTDWEPGHLFVYGDKTVSHYKAGDVFYQEDAWAPHCSVNIGHSIRIILQIRTYK
jgi:hypothetical protein